MRRQHSPIGYKLTCGFAGHIPAYAYMRSLAVAAAQLHADEFDHEVIVSEYTEEVPIRRVRPARERLAS